MKDVLQRVNRPPDCCRDDCSSCLPPVGRSQLPVTEVCVTLDIHHDRKPKWDPPRPLCEPGRVAAGIRVSIACQLLGGELVEHRLTVEMTLHVLNEDVPVSTGEVRAECRAGDVWRHDDVWKLP